MLYFGAYNLIMHHNLFIYYVIYMSIKIDATIKNIYLVGHIILNWLSFYIFNINYLTPIYCTINSNMYVNATRGSSPD